MDLARAFEETKLTPALATSSKTLIEWQEQPSRFKHYPNFLFRYQLDKNDPFDNFCLKLRTITQTLQYDLPYHRLNVPSAGNLHPIEIYLQLRKVPGKMGGIYHLDVEKRELVLIQEIGKEGLEPYLGYEIRQEGVIVMLSTVYFRSAWKYGKRAWRYQLLDMGHQIGALIAAATFYDKPLQFCKESDFNALNQLLGFGEQEQMLCMAALTTPLKRPAQKMLQNCMTVQPTDYYRPDPWLLSLQSSLTPFYETVGTKPLLNGDSSTSQRANAIENRRSARKFTGNAIDEALLEQIMQFSSQAVGSIAAHMILLKSCHTCPGIYDGRTLLEKGSFVHEINHLLLSQSIAYTSAIVLFLSIPNMSTQAYYEAGIFAHELYLFCHQNDVGCTGVGAYLDDETKQFLHTNHDIIYAIAIGELDQGD